MKELVTQIDETIHQKARLGIMTLLASRDEASFGELKELLQLTDGNLSSHIALLERSDYIAVRKSFIGKRPQTTVVISKKGRQALTSYLHLLKKILEA